MPSTDAVPRRALRDRPIGKALALLAVLVVAFFAARTCASSQGEISKDEALEIARERVSFEPDGTQIRNVAQGVPVRRVWAVSFYTGEPTSPERSMIVEVDAETGEILRVHESAP
jgi:uncharacterized membrane protein YkoI